MSTASQSTLFKHSEHKRFPILTLHNCDICLRLSPPCNKRRMGQFHSNCTKLLRYKSSRVPSLRFSSFQKFIKSDLKHSWNVITNACLHNGYIRCESEPNNAPNRVKSKNQIRLALPSYCIPFHLTSPLSPQDRRLHFLNITGTSLEISACTTNLRLLARNSHFF